MNAGKYFTGSVYDIPLNAAMAWYLIISVRYTVDEKAVRSRSGSGPELENLANRNNIVWSARLSMVATLSTPVIGLWLITNGDLHDPVRHFRILITLFTMLLLTVLLFLRQDTLSAKLGGYLEEVSVAYSNVRLFEGQLVQSEKLASLGKLAARVANEIKRAMAAVGKDVENLEQKGSADQSRQKMTAKIADAAKRTNNLVEGMLSFAQEISVHRASVDVRPLLERALSLTRAERRHPVRVEIQEQ